MTLYLVQHGQCFDKAIDPNRNLSPEGRTTIIQVAEIAAKAGITAPVIYHSGKLRALETAESFSQYLKTTQIEKLPGLSPLDNVAEFAKHFHFTDKSMIIGHLPFMDRLCAYLITGNQQPSIIKFQNAGIACLDQDEENHWYLKWTIMPDLN